MKTIHGTDPIKKQYDCYSSKTEKKNFFTHYNTEFTVH